jgi:hypothetical protein
MAVFGRNNLKGNILWWYDEWRQNQLFTFSFYQYLITLISMLFKASFRVRISYFKIFYSFSNRLSDDCIDIGRMI